MKIPTGGILFFDSGIGGLTVLAETLPQFKEQVFLYYGDNDRAPYGNLSNAKILENVQAVFQSLKDLNIRIAVLACNTATAICAESLRRDCGYPIIGAEPAIMPAIRNGGEVLVLATRATCDSERFRALCARARLAYPKTTLKAVACESLAGEIEKNIFRKEFDPTLYLPRESPTAVVLGCTHYIYVKEKIKKFYACPVYDGNVGIASRLSSILKNNEQKKDRVRDERPLKTPALDVKNPNDFLTVKYEKKFLEKGIMPQIFQANDDFKTDSQCFIIDENDNQIFFLGTQKLHNKHIFEQMFVKCRK